MKAYRLISTAILIIAAGLGASNASATGLDPCTISNISLLGIPYEGSGCLPDDAAEQSFLFTLGGIDTLNLYTTSWATGNFAPILTLFDGSGTEIAFDHGGDPGLDTCGLRSLANYDFAGNSCLDAFIQVTLGPGSYRLVLTESGTPGNYATGDFVGSGPNDQSSNYAFYGQPNYTGQQWYGDDSTQQFLSPNNSFPLGNEWSVTIASQLPEPASMLTGLTGLIAMGMAIRRRRADRTGK